MFVHYFDLEMKPIQIFVTGYPYFEASLVK